MRYTGLFYGRDRKQKLDLYHKALKTPGMLRPRTIEESIVVPKGFCFADQAPPCMNCGAERMTYLGRFTAVAIYGWKLRDERLRKRVLSFVDTMSISEMPMPTIDTGTTDPQQEYLTNIEHTRCDFVFGYLREPLP